MRTFVISIFLLSTSLSVPLFVSAQDTGPAPVSQSGNNTITAPAQTTNPAYSQQAPAPGTNVTLINPLKGGGNLESFLKGILAFVVRIGTIIVILMLVYVGYLFVAAQGSDSKLIEARRALLWTVVGALILLGAQAISLGIQATVNAISVGR